MITLNTQEGFINKLIEDNAWRLAFYFIINGYINFDDINQNYLFYKYLNIYYQFNFLFKYLLDKKVFFPGFSIDNKADDYANDLVKYLDEDYNINYKNYGTEGQILDFMFNHDDDEEYLKILQAYINHFKIKIDKQKEYFFQDFMGKIGIQIALYLYIFKGIREDYELDIDSIIKLFNKYLKIAYRTILSSQFLEELKKKVLYTMVEYRFSNNEFIKLQQFYNIYKYKIKYISNHKITFYNSVILNFKLNDNEFYKSKIDYKIKNTFLKEIKPDSKHKYKSSSLTKYEDAINDYYSDLKTNMDSLNIPNIPTKLPEKIKKVIQSLLKSMKILETYNNGNGLQETIKLIYGTHTKIDKDKIKDILIAYYESLELNSEILKTLTEEKAIEEHMKLLEKIKLKGLS
jgi:hypothetical protein